MGLSFSGYGWGKLLLFGEHAAVKGLPALGLALDRGITIELEPSESAALWSLEGYDQAENEIARRVMGKIAGSVPGLAKAGTIRVRSELPMGRGFGSSAALCVALAEAALAASGSPEALRHRGLVWSIAHQAETIFHGRPSGIDTGLAALGGLVGFRPRPPELPEARRLSGWPLYFLVGAVPRVGDAKTLIRRVHEASSSVLSPAQASLAKLGHLAETATSLLALPHSAPIALGSLAKEAEIELEVLGLVAPAIKRLLEAGSERGALGGKMSGAGGGGAFWLLCRDQVQAAELAKELGELARGEGLSEGLELAPFNYSPE